MKIRILAIAMNDGWAYIKIKSQIFLFKPPYTPAFAEKATKEDIEKAVLLAGFEKVNVNFEKLDEAIQYIKDEFVNYRKVNDIKPPSIDEIKQVLHHAPKNVIEKFLHRIETQLLPEHKFKFASEILNDILGLPVTISDKGLRDKAEKIKKKCIEKQEELCKTPKKQERFKNIFREYTISSLVELAYNKSKSKTFFNFS